MSNTGVPTLMQGFESSAGKSHTMRRMPSMIYGSHGKTFAHFNSFLCDDHLMGLNGPYSYENCVV